ncbi:MULTISPECIES: YtxH domain-containing protein [unclassified Actinotalea]|uniref:YtxH domain-containing protein n=1 Tax=unclassified Actinotalea TaxID=2638618 RepID=UPI0015F45DC9|nr:MULTISPECIES: YtxH domain-containing protein [unclassified Actinotalea]
MRIKAALLIGGAVGYVLGTRAGRERFEKLRSSAQTVWENPRVQGTVSDATAFVKEKAPDLTEKVGGAVKSATDAVKSRTGSGSEEVGSSYETSTEDLSGTSTTGTPTNGSGTTGGTDRF